MRKLSPLAISALAFCWPMLANAQAEEGTEPPEEPSLENAIVVQGTRIRGQLLVDQPAVAEYDAEDIQAFGGGSIADIVEAIEPATGGARGRGEGGRPVFLLNGIRVGSRREFYSYPPESIAKVEVFPEEVAQRFGYPPDRRVVNIVLKGDFSSLTLEGEYEQPDRGGYSRNEQEVTYLKIAGGGRLNFNLDLEDTSLLTEAERGLASIGADAPAVAGDPNPAAYRSLVADTRDVEATANYARAFVDSGSSLSANLTLGRTDRLSLSGLNQVILTAPDGASALRSFGAEDPLARRVRTTSVAAASTYTMPLGDFRLTTTLDASRTGTRTRIDRRSDTSDLVEAAANGDLAIDGPLPALGEAGYDTARSTLWQATGLTTVQGIAAEIPAGEIATTFDLGYDWNRITSTDTRTDRSTRLTRGELSTGVNLTLPIASRREDFLAGLGELSLNAQTGVNHLSDFGTLQDWTLGLNWAPFENLNLSATRIWRQAAPSLNALGDPQVIELNVPVYDPATGRNAFATIIDGGNPFLSAETQADWKFGLNWELPFLDGGRLQIDYAVNRSRDVTLTSPAFTSAFERAFPDRVDRDAAGDLVSLDRRPITLFETRSRRVVIGFSKNGSFGRARAERSDAGPDTRPPRDARPGEGRRGPGSERFRQLRERVCSVDTEKPLDPELLPERLRERLRGEDGTIDPVKLAETRRRLCSAEGSATRARGSGDIPPTPFGRGRGGDGRGRYFFNLSHSIELENEVVLAEGGPRLDQLAGEVLASGGIPRHGTRMEAGFFRNGYGLRLSGRYVGEARILDGTSAGAGDLYFSDLATFDVRVFADLGQAFGKEEGPLKGMRLSFIVDNVFDARRRVVDAQGVTPDSYQPFRIDPVGRYLGIDLRKMF